MLFARKPLSILGKGGCCQCAWTWWAGSARPRRIELTSWEYDLARMRPGVRMEVLACHSTHVSKPRWQVTSERHPLPRTYGARPRYATNASLHLGNKRAGRNTLSRGQVSRESFSCLLSSSLNPHHNVRQWAGTTFEWTATSYSNVEPLLTKMHIFRISFRLVSFFWIPSSSHQLQKA